MSADRTSGQPNEKVPSVLYKYATIETARIILTRNAVLWKSPLRFNDPFDGQCDLLWHLRTPEYLARIRRLYVSAVLGEAAVPANMPVDARKGLAIRQARFATGSLAERRHLAELEAAAIYTAEGCAPRLDRLGVLDLQRRMRLFCLSEVNHSILMWSHYASQHCGVVIGFATDILVDAWGPVSRIQYPEGEEVPTIWTADEWAETTVFEVPRLATEEDGKKLVLTKASDWKYEREWRFVGNEPDLSAPGDEKERPLPKGSICSITLGCRTDRYRGEEIVALAIPLSHSRSLEVKCLERHPSKFALRESSRGMFEKRFDASPMHT